MSTVERVHGAIGSDFNILLGVDATEFEKDIAKYKSSNTSIHIGIPFHSKKDRENVLVVKASLFTEDKLIQEVREKLGLFQSELSQSKLSKDRWEVWNSPKYRNMRVERWGNVFSIPSSFRRTQHRIQHQEMWSLMIVDWALRSDSVQAQKYINGNLHLGDALREYVGLVKPPRLMRAVFNKNILDPGVADIKMSYHAWIKLERDHRNRIANMGEIVEIYEGYARVWVSIVALFTGAAPVFVMRAASEAFTGYMDFAMELHDAERDGIITPEESQGAWITLIGMFIPMGTFFGGKTAIISSVVSTAAFAFALTLSMINVAVQVLGKIERKITTLDLNIQDYVETNAEFEIFIPLNPENKI